jgi:CheY-like chemotaxis protein
MRIEDLKPAHVRRAVAIYFDIAWSDDGSDASASGAKPPVTVEDLEQATTLTQLFSMFHRPSSCDERDSFQRYTLRLGNQRYPFMKFVVQEYLVDEEYFFSVDTHDDIAIGPDNPDFAGWLELKRYNADLKQRIEEAWSREGLPTHTQLRVLAEGLAQVEREGQKRARLLVVDDETDVAQGLKALLEGRGYQVECAYDGRQVLDRMKEEPMPDLVVLDYAMPEFDGQEVLRRLRQDPRTESLPVLLTTASSIELKDVQRASGLLRKPYPREVLFAMLGQLLGRGAGS